MLVAFVGLCGCMTNATLSKAKGYPKVDSDGHKVTTEDPQPGYYALVPFAFIGDVATFPLQGLYVVFVWPFFPDDVRERLNQN